MAITKIQILRSSTSGSAPSAGVLDYGQLAINYGTSSLDGSPDGRLFYKDAGNVVRSISSGGGSASGSFTGSFTGSLLGTASVAVSASWAPVAISVSTSSVVEISSVSNLNFTGSVNVSATGSTANITVYTITGSNFTYSWPILSGSIGSVLTISSSYVGTFDATGSRTAYTPTLTCTNSSSFPQSIDGNTNTRWTTNTGQVIGQKYEFQLGSTQSVIGYILDDTVNTADFPTTYDVSGSIISGTWFAITGTIGGATYDSRLFTSAALVTALSFTLQGVQPGHFWSIDEMYLLYLSSSGVGNNVGLIWATGSAGNFSTGSYTGSFTGSLLGTASNAVSAAWAPSTGGGSGNGTIASGTVGQFAFYSGSQILSGSPQLVISGANLVLSASTVEVTGTLNVSGNTVFGGESYTWPLAYGVSGTFLSQDGAGNLVWAIASGSGGGVSSPVAVATSSVQMIASVTQLNFIGTGVTVTAAGNTASINISTGGGGLSSRTTATTAAGIIGSGSTMTGSIIIAKTYAIQQVATNLQATRLRLYTSSSLRDTDVSRSIFSIPGGNHGLITDIFFPSGSSYTTFILSPAVVGFNTDSTATASFTIDNYSSGSANISMSITYVQLEA